MSRSESRVYIYPPQWYMPGVNIKLLVKKLPGDRYLLLEGPDRGHVFNHLWQKVG
jgi:hypothetical protein